MRIGRNHTSDRASTVIGESKLKLMLFFRGEEMTLLWPVDDEEDGDNGYGRCG
ncbi:hypothetical protein PC116_g33572 [Phytophthora cactorum]|nr:hypothetical protein PC116_g33572 [Phytophthora cactorum]